MRNAPTAGQGMAQAFSIIGGIAAVVLLVPAVLLALNGRWLGLDLVLVVIAAFFVLMSLVSTF